MTSSDARGNATEYGNLGYPGLMINKDVDSCQMTLTQLG
jgi:hypothetical protein